MEFEYPSISQETLRPSNESQNNRLVAVPTVYQALVGPRINRTLVFPGNEYRGAPKFQADMGCCISCAGNVTLVVNYRCGIIRPIPHAIRRISADERVSRPIRLQLHARLVRYGAIQLAVHSASCSLVAFSLTDFVRWGFASPFPNRARSARVRFFLSFLSHRLSSQELPASVWLVSCATRNQNAQLPDGGATRETKRTEDILVCVLACFVFQRRVYVRRVYVFLTDIGRLCRKSLDDQCAICLQAFRCS